MDNSKLKDQITKRLEKDTRKAKAEEGVLKSQEEQKEKQKRRGDYAEILRANMYGAITVKNPGDYADDLLDFQEQVLKIITSIPAKFITDKSAEDLSGFFEKMMDSIKITGNNGESLESLMSYQVKARTTIAILSDESIQQNVYSSCIGTTIGSRFSTMAYIVHTQNDLLPVKKFELICKKECEKFLITVNEVNALEYITDNYRPYILSVDLKHEIWGNRYSNELPGDPVHALINTIPYSEGEQASLKNRMVPRIESIKKLVAGIKSVNFPKESLKDFADSYRDVPGLFHQLMHKLEIFGVWTTNQCVDHSTMPHYLGSLTDQMIDLINQYMEVSPVAVAYMLHGQSVSVGTHMFYNCPEESSTDNSLESAKVLQIFKHPKVIEVFQGQNSPTFIKDRLEKLRTVINRELKWVDRGVMNYYLNGRDSSPGFFVETWLKNLENEEYWVEKKAVV